MKTMKRKVFRRFNQGSIGRSVLDPFFVNIVEHAVQAVGDVRVG